MQVKSFVFNPFMENTYVLYDRSKKAVVVDPGAYEPYETQQLEAFLKEEDLQLTQVINTHGHIDHVLGNVFVKQRWAVPLAIPRAEKATYEAVKEYAPVYGFPQYQEAAVDQWLDEGDEIRVGDAAFTVLHTPGHSPGHVVFYHAKEGVLIGGDVLFREGIGRTDLPGGDHETLLRSIREKLFALPDDTQVYPGHGEVTTLAHEKKCNPFCALSVS